MLSIIIPTLGTREQELSRLFESLEKQTSTKFEVIVVSQDKHEVVADLLGERAFAYKQVQLNKRGLSYARNEGIKAISGQYVTFSDDDCWYPNDAFEKVEDFFNQNKAQVVCYQIFDPTTNQSYKSYPTEKADHVRTRDLFRKSSIEMFVDVQAVDRQYLCFNESFGLGAKHPSGEENIFLFSLQRAGYTISYIPEVIVYHLKPTQASRLDERTMVSKGALFGALYSKPVDIILLTALFAKKIRHVKRPIHTYAKAVALTFSEKEVKVNGVKERT
ncbi:glycosyltransferase family 2 protein [Alkalicoccobacillus murimartini]|uniref:Glycosyltransferase involved in cell wall biosynthesis n=1 Tax=Alkalicoccobacillus murimartini TaxID=171685 RepID=A0ABT9YG16_9BACI|nr:glycosyltransferase family 2 protein [Alkalicoccobacillus murimartini]MDQ0206798.1 glycosyltransferase involved in cell wall biosynthesis [Alkalicoccobacillus murimartini]